MKKSEHMGLRTWIEIDTKAIHANYRAFRKLVPKNVQIMGIVKSNAYGHNLTEFALELEKIGIDMLAVDSLVEAFALRKSGVKKPILVLGYTLPEMFVKALRKKIHLTISSIDGLQTFLKTPNTRQIPIHLKIDTGMHRQGFLLREVPQVLKILKENKVQVAGLYTHFASAKDVNNRVFTESQIAEFVVWRTALRSTGFSLIAHACATGGVFGFRDAHFDMVRIGAGLYGFWTADEIKRVFNGSFSLSPALSWKTIISEIKEIPAGSGIGYDLTHKTAHVMRIAVCPVGYWHGYPRLLSSNADVLVRGARAKVLGRVSMDMIVVDVTQIPRVKVGDEVVLIGFSGKEEILASELAERSGTSAYEILTRLNPLMKRIYK
ncbi:MAG: alanine racemase [Candidatus Yonathbacteria bacterium RIFCSPHIGHO2_01_FULL_44_41]|uniref:Alanine racemase n=1 Tax=Candidatus Yonathbacteria bacterium RIFCSPHIGHO2_02_FULL_44_14 TaxID=1802724 RepID=A0A1G2S8G0_9BACT|nr:MAG: alanine racemase [Candidatus Yonathbacteria bacterium RIFCSPHIGHO2_01_FULL_44_41]OHA80859.1 MAG: alanine racemase [Candidatus Yonathbacteria bacterium RIFCSPLOWO2_01_FULL_43_20]OHA81356.1 MAG: alanine racemase [Candidatus Yonathbacteria bacterium RIFCSPHIGHO2_02_FULL_44_14]